MKENIAVFDFDGTLSQVDTLLAFAGHVNGRLGLAAGVIGLLPMLAGRRLGRVTDTRAKEHVLQRFYRGRQADEIKSAGRAFLDNHLSLHRDPFHWDRLLTHLRKGHRTILLTANFDFMLEYWCKHYGIKLIATRTEVKDGIITGAIEGTNCHGEEKLARLRAEVPENSASLYGYGDSAQDLLFLSAMDHAWYRGKQILPRSGAGDLLS